MKRQRSWHLLPLFKDFSIANCDQSCTNKHMVLSPYTRKKNVRQKACMRHRAFGRTIQGACRRARRPICQKQHKLHAVVVKIIYCTTYFPSLGSDQKTLLYQSSSSSSYSFIHTFFQSFSNSSGKIFDYRSVLLCMQGYLLISLQFQQKKNGLFKKWRGGTQKGMDICVLFILIMLLSFVDQSQMGLTPTIQLAYATVKRSSELCRERCRNIILYYSIQGGAQLDSACESDKTKLTLMVGRCVFCR